LQTPEKTTEIRTQKPQSEANYGYPSRASSPEETKAITMIVHTSKSKLISITGKKLMMRCDRKRKNCERDTREIFKKL